MNGALLIDKPEGLSSFDVLRILKKKFPQTKMGHLGTLDPMATGLLVVFLGTATRLIRYFEGADKTYIAQLEFGKTSDTYDRTGKVDVVSRGPWPSRETLERAMKAFLGSHWQIQPAFSALKIGGRRAYDLAREGKHVNLGKRQVTIRELEVIDYEPPFLDFRVSCSSGTYVRSFIHELGQLIGCGALMSRLRRASVSRWRIGQAKPPEAIGLSDLVSSETIIREYIDFSKTSEGEKDWLLKQKH